MEIAEVLTVVVTLIGSLGTTLPILAKFKLKVNQARNFLATLDEALADNKLSPDELKLIMRSARAMVGKSI